MGCLTVIKNMKKKYERSKSQIGSRNEKVSTAMPQLQASRSLHFDPQNPKTSVKSPNPINQVTNNRTRTLSAPSALQDAEALASVEQEEGEMSKSLARLMKVAPLPSPVPSPLPLPLPSPRNRGPLKLRMASDPFYASGSGNDTAEQDGVETFQCDAREWYKNRDRSMKKMHLARPLPLPPKGRYPLKATSSPKPETVIDPVRFFLYEEIVAACHNFRWDRCMAECFSSTIYKASFFHEASCKKLKATVTRLHPSTQGLREFMNEVSSLAKIQHPNICKLLGFYACDTSETRMLVYERLSNGSLDSLLFRRPDGPSIDWNTRMKIAFSAAQGLTFLHDEGSFKAMYTDFSAANIQIDIDFNAKLSGYGFVGNIAQETFSRRSAAAGNLSVETWRKGKLTPKSNIWSFGIILLELLTGRKNFDINLPKRERNLVKWCQPFLADNLSVIMDPQLEGRFPPKAARIVAGIAQRCLQKEPSERPTMKVIVENLIILLDMQYPRWFQLHDPAAVYRRQMAESLNVDGISYGPSLGFSPPCLPSIGTSPSHPPRWSSVPVALPPPLARSSTVITEEITREESTKQSSSVSEKA
ncbi:probable serine/threonine-protein kinase PBL16 [Vicia villosa]|uniref:probable serine/threonine-protein kinase PBL16 n=1 Tax=Vicia villosa TaxID=3911 RepID=UPI00273C8322|nr:probable serine/threonine-protein kinase PBL16 [Vicia villosa]